MSFVAILYKVTYYISVVELDLKEGLEWLGVVGIPDITLHCIALHYINFTFHYS